MEKIVIMVILVGISYLLTFLVYLITKILCGGAQCPKCREVEDRGNPDGEMALTTNDDCDV